MGRGRDWIHPRGRLLAAGGVAVALGLGACGGDGEEEAETGESPEAAVEEVVTEFGASRGSDACNYGNQEFLNQFGGRKGCDKAFVDEGAVDYTISGVQVDGETATAIADSGQGVREFELALVSGEWKISSVARADKEAVEAAEAAAAVAEEEEAEAAGAESSEAAVEQTLVDYAAAEGLAACDYLTQEWIDAIGGERSACADNPATTDVQVTRVEVNGDKASAKMAFEGGLGNGYELVLEDGDWKISREILP
jgi:hypothetical protein